MNLLPTNRVLSLVSSRPIRTIKEQETEAVVAFQECAIEEQRSSSCLLFFSIFFSFFLPPYLPWLWWNVKDT